MALADPSAAEISAARHAFEVAVKLEADQHWREAELKLRDAVEVKDTPGLRFHLAHCAVEQGHLVAAAAEYERASELLRQGAKAPDVDKLLGPASAALKRRIPRLSLELTADVASPAVSVDGRPYAPSELALGVPLDPGKHDLRVSAPGRIPYQQSMVLNEGDQVSVRAELAPTAPSPAPVVGNAEFHLAPPAPPNALPSNARARSSHTKLYLMIGESAFVGLGVAVGIAYRVRLSRANDRIAFAQGQIDAATPRNGSNACGASDRPDLAPTCADLKSAIDDHDRAALLSTIGFIGAGVGAAALITTWLALPGDRTDNSGLAVQVQAGFGRVALTGRF